MNDVPFSDDDLGDGPKDLVWFPISHIERPSERTPINQTLEGHLFHPGNVTFTVLLDRDTGDIHVQVEGRGTGAHPRFNNQLGRALFGSLVYRIMWRHMR